MVYTYSVIAYCGIAATMFEGVIGTLDPKSWDPILMFKLFPFLDLGFLRRIESVLSPKCLVGKPSGYATA